MNPFLVHLTAEKIASYLGPSELLYLSQTTQDIHDTLITFPKIDNRLKEAGFRVRVGGEYLYWKTPFNLNIIIKFLTHEEVIILYLAFYLAINNRIKIRACARGEYLDQEKPLDIATIIKFLTPTELIILVVTFYVLVAKFGNNKIL